MNYGNPLGHFKKSSGTDYPYFFNFNFNFIDALVHRKGHCDYLGRH